MYKLCISYYKMGETTHIISRAKNSVRLMTEYSLTDVLTCQF